MSDFVWWLNAELNKRGWSRSEAARRGGISPSMFDKVIGGFAKPGLGFCQGIARAFGIPLEDVFRYAGILPSTRPIPDANDLIRRFSLLPKKDQDFIQRVLEDLLRQAESRTDATPPAE